jgi:hypothetical protein
VKGSSMEQMGRELVEGEVGEESEERLFEPTLIA